MLSPPTQLYKIQPKLVLWVAQKLSYFWPRPLGPQGRGGKVKYPLISITKSISKIFIPNFVCVLTNKRYTTYQKRFSFCHLGHAPGMGLVGAWRSKIQFFRTWSACDITNWREWWVEQDTSKIITRLSNWCQTLGWGQKVKYH